MTASWPMSMALCAGLTLLAGTADAGTLALDWGVSFGRTSGGQERLTSGFVDAMGNQYILTDEEDGLPRVRKFDAAGTQVLTFLPAGPYPWGFVSMAADAAGRMYFAGRDGSGGLTAAKYDAAGVHQWTSVYGSGTIWQESGYRVTVGPSGEVFVAGAAVKYNPIGFSWTSYGLVVALDSGGTIAWSRTIDVHGYDMGHQVVLDGAGNPYVIGSSVHLGYEWPTWVARFSTAGAPIFTRTVSSSNLWPGGKTGVWRASDASLIVAQDILAGFQILRVDPATGDVLANRVVQWDSNTQKEATDLAIGPGGAVLFAGSSYSFSTSESESLIVRYSSDLSTSTWVHTVRADRNVSPDPAVGVDGAGDVRFNTDINGDGLDGGCGEPEDVLLRALSPAGSEIWTRMTDGPPEESAVGVESDGAGGVLAAIFGGGYSSLVRRDALGIELWERDLDVPGTCNLRVESMARFGSMTYTSLDGPYLPSGNWEVIVERYNNSGTGGLWARFDQIPSTNSGPIAFDPAGNLYMAASYNSSTSYDLELLVLKFDTSGALTWSRTFSYTDYNWPVAIAVDNGGGVFVVQNYHLGTGTQQLRHLIRLTTGGSVAWTRTLPGDNAWASGLCTDGTNVYLVGSDAGDRAEVQKIDSAGALIWSRTFATGPLSVFLDAKMDGSGNLLATGYRSTTWYGSADLIAASYDATGVERWTLVEDLGSEDEFGASIAGGSVLIAGSSADDSILRKYLEVFGPLASLQGALAVGPNPVPVGATFQVVLTVTNSGAGAATGVTATVYAGPGGGSVLPVGTVNPAGAVTIAGGATQRFTWTYSVTGAGGATFTATASGINSGTLSGIAISRTATLSPAAAAVFASSLSLNPASACGGIVTLALTTTNTGGFTATLTGAAVGSFGPVVLAGLSGPVPAVPFALAAGASVTQRWTASITGSGAPPHVLWGSVSGIDQLGGGALWATASRTGSFQAGAAFAASVQAPAAASIGSWFTVALTVSNTGGFSAGAVSPTLWIMSGGSLVAPVSGPSPAGPVGIPGGGVQSFVWTFSASGAGSVSLTVTASGSETCGGSVLAWSRTVGLLVQAPAWLAVSATASRGVMRQGERITVTMFVANSGGASASGVQPWLAWNPAVPAPFSLVSGPLPAGPGFVAGGGNGSFVWSFEAVRSGPMVLTVSASGTDGNSGLPLEAAAALPWTVTVTPAAVLRSVAGVSPAVIRAGGAVEVRLTVTNSGDAPATAIAPTLALSDPALGLVFSGPVPAGGGLLSAGSVAEFVWRVEALAAGRLVLFGSLGGSDGTLYVSSAASASADITPGLADAIALYPNPLSGGSLSVHLKLEHDAETVELEAFNAAFARVARATWTTVSKYGGPLRLDGIASWAPGPYLVRVTATYAGGTVRSFPLVRVLVKR